MKDALPRASARELAFAADVLRTVMSAAAKAISSQNRSGSDVGALAVAVGEMLCGHLERYLRVEAG